MTRKINYYKYSTYLLLALLIVGGLFYSHISIKHEAYEKGILFGQENTVDIILKKISNDGKITIETKGGNITLLPQSTHNQELLKYTQNIITTANEQGYITLKTDSDQLTLIKLDPMLVE